MIQTSVLTASEARSNLYKLIKKASGGLRTFEINLRGSEPVLLVSKKELENWLETLDVLSSKEEVDAIKESKKSKKTYSHKDMVKLLNL